MMQTKFKNYHNDKKILQHPVTQKLFCLRCYLRFWSTSAIYLFFQLWKNIYLNEYKNIYLALNT